MNAKIVERDQAILLRKQGLSYREIRKKIPVAKSTLSLWFRDVQLAKRQQQRLTELKRLAQLRGARARHTQRLEQTAQITERSRTEIARLTPHEKLLIGIVLYWAEGTKQRMGNWGGGVQFGNSDPRMALLFQKWLLEVIKLDVSDIRYEVYLHENNKHRLSEVRNYWANQLSIPASKLQRIYFKRHNPKSNRKNQGKGYYGLVRICARSSSVLNRRIAGWVEGIVENWGVV
ncbi:MAG TPA: hypothetical protein VJG64_03150 [Candidatus Paceibacterota bacterium]